MKALHERKRHILIALAVFFANFLADKVTKIAAEALLKNRGSIELLKKTVVFMYVENRGAFLSFGAHWSRSAKEAILLVIPIALCIVFVLYSMFREADKRRIAMICTIAGGGVGNLLDRLVHDFRVIDFMNFGIADLRTGVLNVADLSVTFGTAALFFYELGSRKGKPPAPPQEPAEKLD
ncbi:MAG: signal peptidase II [Spirochaetaceae bacterium]|jgi:signal peptidase II|nr:signal peptidase II [Spirochaetaceae bacterium]